ncbi:MAG TPA: helix-turn-helix transcriptional regulator [Phycisphaerales bacterium]|nr:helix-turn-helix transcriptional regulator [Phycisphaerales bacterium]
MGLRSNIGAEIRTRRTERGWTLRDLADRCGISFQMLGQIETAYANTTLEAVERIVQALDLVAEVSLRDPSEPATASALAIENCAPEDRALLLLLSHALPRLGPGERRVLRGIVELAHEIAAENDRDPKPGGREHARP